MFENELEKLLTDAGADIVGFSYLGDSVCREYPQYKYAVTIIKKLSYAVIDTINGAPTMAYFQHYRAINARLDSICLDAVSYIEKKGYLALPIAASQSTPDNKDEYRGLFPHKTGAVLSGTGFIGKNCLLITKEYGSAVRLATVLTDMPLSPQREVIIGTCGNCRKCIDACPAGALTGNEYITGADRSTVFNAEKCSAHMKTYKNIGRGAVCGLCMRACPYNIRRKD